MIRLFSNGPSFIKANREYVQRDVFEERLDDGSVRIVDFDCLESVVAWVKADAADFLNRLETAEWKTAGKKNQAPWDALQQLRQTHWE
jgi:hypothetical protein